MPGNRGGGSTAIEYGLIVALIAVVIITAIATLGGKSQVDSPPNAPPATEQPTRTQAG